MQHIKQLPSSQILTHLTSTVQQYRQNLCQFQQFIQASLSKNNATRNHCSAILGGAFLRFKDKFLEFRNQWVDELPNVCREFMDIVKKICTLYEQELDRLTKINQKWQFSYHQLVKSTKHSPNPSPHPNKSERNSLQKPAPANQTPSLNLTLSKSLSSTFSSSLQTNLQQTSQIMPICKPKQHQITLMRQQITQLFDEEEDNSQCFVHTRNGKVLKQVKDYGNCQHKLRTQNNRIFTSAELQQIRQFRLKTSNDEGSSAVQPATKNTNSTTTYSSKNSQNNSRKNSLGHRQQFWQTLQNNLNNVTSSKFNTTMQIPKVVDNTKDKQKQNSFGKKYKRKSIGNDEGCQEYQASHEKGRERDKQQRRLSTYTCGSMTSTASNGGSTNVGSKLNELKRNMYKNKNNCF